MQIHHLDCVTSCPLGGLVMDGRSKSLRGRLACHCLLVEDGKNDWLLLAGDAYFYWAEMDLVRPRCTPGLRFYQAMMENDRSMRLRNQRRLRALKRKRGNEDTIISSHDKYEFEACAHHPLVCRHLASLRSRRSPLKVSCKEKILDVALHGGDLGRRVRPPCFVMT